MSIKTSLPVLTAAEMQTCDEYTIHHVSVPSQVLMERAAQAVAAFLFRRKDLFPHGRILCLCGSGNNGGDGFAAARFLADGSMGDAREVTILYTGRYADASPDTTAMSAECARQYRLSVDAGIPVMSSEKVTELLPGASCVVDALFGIGLVRPIEGQARTVVEAVRASGLPVLAVDIPSGIHADTGEIMGVALKAAATVTMQALKRGLLLGNGIDHTGEITVVDIGVHLSCVRKSAYLADEALLRRVLLPRERRSHKGSYGRAVLFCGSIGMGGAAILSARAALRTGVGLCEVVTPEENRAILQISVPEAIVTGYPGRIPAIGAMDAEGLRGTLRKTVQNAIERADAVVIGCGLGQSESARSLLRTSLSCVLAAEPPLLVLDADALNLLADDETLWETPLLSSRCGRVVLTPHPAEMARLCQCSVREILLDVPAAALTLAQRRGVCVVLKDAHTVIASPDGTCFICPFGNAGMATGGTGDALAGVIGAMLAQNATRITNKTTDLTVAEIAAAGVYLHARAGDLAAESKGEIGLLPSDLIDHLPLVTRSFSDSRTRLSER